jgi:hypothetical protein
MALRVANGVTKCIAAPVPRAGRKDREVSQGLGHRRQLHAPHHRRGQALRAAQAAGSHAHHRVPPGRGMR